MKTNQTGYLLLRQLWQMYIDFDYRSLCFDVAFAMIHIIFNVIPSLSDKLLLVSVAILVAIHKYSSMFLDAIIYLSLLFRIRYGPFILETSFTILPFWIISNLTSFNSWRITLWVTGIHFLHSTDRPFFCLASFRGTSEGQHVFPRARWYIISRVTSLRSSSGLFCTGFSIEEDSTVGSNFFFAMVLFVRAKFKRVPFEIVMRQDILTLVLSTSIHYS